MAQTIGEKNPFRYRGYYYDSESGFYYLNSRYYDPAVGRFINADTTDVLDVDQDSLIENNLFAYCLNNPVNMADSEGEIAWFVAAALGGALWDTSFYLIGCAVSGQKVTLKGVAKSAAIGAVTGLCLGAVGKIATKAVKATSVAFKSKNAVNATKKSFSVVGKSIKLSNQVQKLVKSASKLKYSKTALSHLSSRPYMNSTLTIQNIMKSVKPVSDKSLKNGLKWITKGSYNGSSGTWELVVDISSNRIVHFLFRGGK